MKKHYTIQELADRMSVSTRTIERYLKALYIKESNKIIIPLDVVELLEVRHKSDTSPTGLRQDSDNSSAEQYDIVEGFTNEEYQEFQKRLIEYPLLKDKIDNLKNDIDYHRKSAQSQNKQLVLLLENLQQRNFIEAKNKFKE